MDSDREDTTLRNAHKLQAGPPVFSPRTAVTQSLHLNQKCQVTTTCQHRPTTENMEEAKEILWVTGQTHLIYSQAVDWPRAALARVGGLAVRSGNPPTHCQLVCMTLLDPL